MQDRRVLRPVNDAMLNDRFVTAGKEVCNLHLYGKNDALPVHNMKAHGELEVYRHPFLYPSLDGVSFQLHASAALPQSLCYPLNTKFTPLLRHKLVLRKIFRDKLHPVGGRVHKFNTSIGGLFRGIPFPKPGIKMSHRLEFEPQRYNTNPFALGHEHKSPKIYAFWDMTPCILVYIKVKQSHYRPSGLWGSGRLRHQNF
jgi:hypothetical protein